MPIGVLEIKSAIFFYVQYDLTITYSVTLPPIGVPIQAKIKLEYTMIESYC